MGHAEDIRIAQELVVHVSLELKIIEAVCAGRSVQADGPFDSGLQFGGADAEQPRHLPGSKEAAYRKIDFFRRNLTFQIFQPSPALRDRAVGREPRPFPSAFSAWALEVLAAIAWSDPVTDSAGSPKRPHRPPTLKVQP